MKKVIRFVATTLAAITLALVLAPLGQGIAVSLPMPRVAAPPATLPHVYYRTASGVWAINPNGTGAMQISTTPTDSSLQPVLLPDGRLLYPSGNGYAAINGSGGRSAIPTPSLNPGESVWSVSGSPDGQSLAWQLFAPRHVGTYTLNQGASRVVVTGREGGDGNTVLTDGANGDAGGQVLTLLGWRSTSNYGTGDATLLLQDLYSINDATARILPNAARGLIDYDPAIGDIVDDYLPPTTVTEPAQRCLTLSQDGTWAIYGDDNAVTPSGEGPLARVLTVLNLTTNTAVSLDTANRYPGSRTITVTEQHKQGKHTVTISKAQALPLYQYFSHNAFVAPDLKHVLYTRLTVSYPPHATTPTVDHQAMIVQMNGKAAHALTGGDTEGEGWITSDVAVVKEPDGLYTVDTATGQTARLVADPSAQLVGVRQ